MLIEKFEPAFAGRWNEFVAESRNGTFLFHRDFMEYHADRFKDHSLIVTHRDLPIALFPASIAAKRNALESHGGLTMGGLIFKADMTQELCLGALDKVMEHARSRGLVEIRYKMIPYIYHLVPSDEDRYALFRLGAVLYRRDVASVIALGRELPWQKRRSRGLKKAHRLRNAAIGFSNEWRAYWDVLNAHLLNRHKTKPVHSVEEITALATTFPRNIQLVTAQVSGHVHAGVVLFLSETTARCQYIAADDYGREHGLLDAIFAFAIEATKPNRRYFDFGSSMKPDDGEISEGLLAFKQGYGARTVVYDHYRLDL